MSAVSRQRGFTLIELLVVIVIIATLAGMATLSLGNSDSRQWTGEAQRLANLMQLVADRALIDREHLGVSFEDGGYTVVRYQPSTMRWEELDFAANPQAANARRFSAHTLPPNMRLEVRSETELPGSDGNRDKENNLQPQFAALASGEVLPVEIALHLLRNGNVARSALISYSSLHGMQLEWIADDY